MHKLFPVNVRSSPKLPGNSIVVPGEVLRTANAVIGQQVELSFGKRMVSVRLAGTTPESPGNQSIYLAENIRQQLLLPASVLLNLLPDRNTGRWRLGPLIGIFANRFEKAGKPFGEQTSFFRSLKAAAARLNAFCFAFCPDDIHWEKEVIRGFVPPLPGQDTGEWETMVLPFPDVMYDRGLFPRGVKRNAATNARKVLRNYPGVRFFNPFFFGKWKTHKLLAKHDGLFPYLPETRFISSMADIEELVQRHRTVYLKPSGGSSGKGIMRLTLTREGYSVENRVTRNVQTRIFPERAGLEASLCRLINEKRFIVQQGLDLAKAHGCPFDIRVLMQKDMAGRWQRTGMATRVAAPGSYITNIHAGGKATRISSLLTQAFPGSEVPAKVMREIRRVCSLAVSWLSAEGSPLFGETAIDLGVDTAGRVWIIEFNAIPGRSVFRRIRAANILARAIARPMEYSFFLAGFSMESHK